MQLQLSGAKLLSVAAGLAGPTKSVRCSASPVHMEQLGHEGPVGCRPSTRKDRLFGSGSDVDPVFTRAHFLALLSGETDRDGIETHSRQVVPDQHGAVDALVVGAGRALTHLPVRTMTVARPSGSHRPHGSHGRVLAVPGVLNCWARNRPGPPAV